MTGTKKNKLTAQNNMEKQINIPRGTRIIRNAETRREFVNKCANVLKNAGYEEIMLPSIDYTKVYRDKMGDDIDEQLYTMIDKKGRELCLRPEVTATASQLYDPRVKDIKVWYYEKCWRYERPQKGRYREFYQLGVEILNPTQDFTDDLLALANVLLSQLPNCPALEVVNNAKRGLTYYKKGRGFEIIAPSLGAQKQIVGGGAYTNGIGFAIGVDRLPI